MPAKIPVTVLTGFLGAGKTTLLNRLLSSPQGAGVAVIVNEFGEVGIDGALIASKEGNVIELSNGALCCAAMGDTVQVLAQLIDLSATKDVRRVVIETTGLADPFPLVRAFLNRPTLAKAYELDALVTVVDAFHLPGQLESTPEAKEQIAAADIVLLNKTDLVSAEDLSKAEGLVFSINPRAEVRRTLRSETDLATLLDTPARGREDRPYAAAANFANETHGHNAGVASVSFKEPRPLSLEKVSRWIAESLMLNGEKLMRYKGILHIADREERFVFQGVHMHFETVPDRPWKPGEERLSQVVLIGRDLDKATLEEAFRACVQ